MIFFIDYSLKSHYSFIFATSLPVLFKITVFDQLVFKYMVYLHCKNFRTFQTLDPFILVEPVFFFFLWSLSQISSYVCFSRCRWRLCWSWWSRAVKAHLRLQLFIMMNWPTWFWALLWTHRSRYVLETHKNVSLILQYVEYLALAA